MTEVELMELVGNNIKAVLKESWMTQKELSEETGINETLISRYIRGERLPSLKNLINIANVFECPLTDLVDADERIL